MDNKQLKSVERSNELHLKGQKFLMERKDIALGINSYYCEQYNSNRRHIMNVFNSDVNMWTQWEWQISHQISDINIINSFYNFSKKEINEIIKVSKIYHWGITPYYASLMDPNNQNDPIKKMAIPSIQELIESGQKDPSAEEFSNPVVGIIRRYPDRVILNVTNFCAGYCRHCQRKRNISERSNRLSESDIIKSINYIKKHTEIRDVLITGGDPLTLRDEELENILYKIREIRHVEIIRIGTRVPVTMPQRITNQLVSMLKKYQPLFINTQFNHPREITPESSYACSLLRDGGIILGNQMVLLNGVNNDKLVVRLLNQELLKIGVKPYYIFYAKNVSGTMHFQTTIQEGLDIIDYLQGNTSGLAIPRFIFSAPGGKGKIPLQTNYIVNKNENSINLKTWEGEIIKYIQSENL